MIQSLNNVYNNSVLIEDTSRSRIILFILFLAPITMSFSDMGISVNYTYLLLLFSSRTYYKNIHALTYCIFLFISLIFGLLIFSDGETYSLLRQLVSFSVTILPLMLLFVRVKITLEEFVSAVIWAAVIYSLFAIYFFMSNQFYLRDIYFTRGALRAFIPDWPQRYVIVLLFAFFVSLERGVKHFFWYIIAVLIFVTIILTFTRAAWIGFLLGIIQYYFSRRKKDKGFKNISNKYKLISLIVIIGVVIIIWRNEFLSNGITQLLNNTTSVIDANPKSFSYDSSEGNRMSIWNNILEILQKSPLTGTGLAGMNLFSSENGSAESQYMDVFLRTGLIGLVLYISFWKRLYSFYKNISPGIVSGLLALFIVGFFHETTKLSYGNLIFVILLSKMYEIKRNKIKESINYSAVK